MKCIKSCLPLKVLCAALCAATLACNLGTAPATTVPTEAPSLPPGVTPTANTNAATAIIASATAFAAQQTAQQTPGNVTPSGGTPGSTGGTAVSTTLQVGGTAIVNCLGRDPIALRSDPTRGSTILTSLSPLSVVQVVGGPTSAEGFTWWNIQTNSGQKGWTVEFADNLPVLTATQCGAR